MWSFKLKRCGRIYDSQKFGRAESNGTNIFPLANSAPPFMATQGHFYTDSDPLGINDFLLMIQSNHESIL